MKRWISIITLIGCGASLTAQNQSDVELAELDIEPTDVAKQFYSTPEWERAFAGSYGVNPGVEPGVPDDQDAREVLGEVRTFLQAGTKEAVREGISALDEYFQSVRDGGDKVSPMLLQINGTLNMRLAELSEDEDERDKAVDRAEELLKQAVSEDAFPNFLRAHKNLANLLFRNDKQDEAKEHFIKSLALGDKDFVTYGLLGAIYMEEGNYLSAESALRNSMMLNPDITEFKQLLGQVLLNQERYNEAKEVFGELMLRNPGETNFWMAQSNSYLALDMIDEAANNLEVVRFMGNANAPSLMLLGDVYMNKEMTDEAAEVYSEALEKSSKESELPNYIRAVETLNNFAAFENAMELLEDINEAYTDLSEEDEIELLSLRSEINIALGKGDEAAENLEALLKRDPFNGRALISLARYYTDRQPPEDLDEQERKSKKNEYQQQAILYYERAQELEDNTRVQVRAFVGEAQLRVQRDELEEAVNLLKEAQNIEYQDSVQGYLDQIEGALQNRRRS